MYLILLNNVLGGGGIIYKSYNNYIILAILLYGTHELIQHNRKPMQLPKANAVKSWIQNMDQFGPDPWFLRKLSHQFATPITHQKKNNGTKMSPFRISSLQLCQSIWHRLHPGEHRLAAPYSGMPPTGKNARPTAQRIHMFLSENSSKMLRKKEARQKRHHP